MRRSTSSVSNSGHWKIQLSDAELQIGISSKLKQFIVSVKQKIQKVVINSKKAQQNLQEQTVHHTISEVIESCMIPGSNLEGKLLFLLSEKLISFKVQYPTWVYCESNENSALFLWVPLFSHKRLIEVNMEGLIFIWNLLAAYSLLFHHFNEQKNYQK